MNKIEIRSLIAHGLVRHISDTETYGYLSEVETVNPSPADPAPHLIVSAPDPLGDVRRFRIDVTEIEQEGVE